MSEEIKVGLAELKVSKSPDRLMSLGLGSCVGIAIYDPLSKIGGLAHAMLPDINMVKVRTNRAKFVNTSIEELVKRMEKIGANPRHLKAKLIGGAHMFSFVKSDVLLNVGDRNVIKAKEELQRARVKLVAEDVGGNYGRSVTFDLETGKVYIRTIAHGNKEI